MTRHAAGGRVAIADGADTVSGNAANGEGSLHQERGGWREIHRVPGDDRPRRVRGRPRAPSPD